MNITMDNIPLLLRLTELDAEKVARDIDNADYATAQSNALRIANNIAQILTYMEHSHQEDSTS